MYISCLYDHDEGPLLRLAGMLSNSYTMGCPPVRGDNSRALASGLSYVQVDKHGITILYSVDLEHHEIFRGEVGKGGINEFTI